MTIAKAELDSHADTCCLGENCLVIHDTEQLVSVEPFDKKLGSQQVKIVTAVVAYDCPATRNVFVLFFHQALHIPDLQKHLLCPNQLRHNQILINDTPLLSTSHQTNATIITIPSYFNNPIPFYTFHSLLMALPLTLILGSLPGKKSTTLMSALIYM